MRIAFSGPPPPPPPEFPYGLFPADYPEHPTNNGSALVEHPIYLVHTEPFGGTSSVVAFDLPIADIDRPPEAYFTL